MNVLVTGGTGFIGSRLATRAAGRGDAVRVLAQLNTPAEVENAEELRARGMEVLEASITDEEAVREAVSGVDSIFHLAATQHEMNVPDAHFRTVNVEGTRTLLLAARDEGIRQFTHGSTIGVYGSLTGLITEDSPLKPDNIYGRTKLDGESIVLSFRSRLPVVVVRIPEVYGPGDRRLLKLFRAIGRDRFFMIGRGDNLHHPIFVEDLVDGLLLAAASSAATGEVIVFAGKEAVSTAEMVSLIAGALGHRGARFRVPLAPFAALAQLIEMTFRPLGIQPPLHRRRLDFFRKSFRLSGEKASKLLGFVPATDFAEGARLTADWYRKRGLI